MTIENQEEVKKEEDEIEYEKTYIKPATEEENEKEPPQESSPEEQSVEEEPKEQLVRRQELPEKQEPKEVEGETPREKALRLETQRLRGLLRKQRGSEIMGETPKSSFFVKEEKKDTKKQEILEKYNPEEINNLKEVLGVMADDLGFVKKDEYQANTYQDVFQEEWDKFLKLHKEYLPENDKDDVLWNRFREEFQLYAKPQNPRDFKKIFNRVNTTIFGSPTEELKKINAQQEKIKNASHAGTTPASSVSRSSTPVYGIRTDMLKGFTQEEIDEIMGQ